MNQAYRFHFNPLFRQVHAIELKVASSAIAFSGFLENAVSLVAAGGALSVVLQLPGKVEQTVGSSEFPSMLTLKDHFSLVDPGDLRRALEGRGFQIVHEVSRSVPAGKRLWMGIFQRS